MSALTKLFLGSSATSAAASGLNLLGTVLVVRWFGAPTYAHYVVDLAMVSLMMTILEIVPSNYSVFRIQDDPTWQRSVAAQISVTIVLALVVVTTLGSFSSLFQAYTGWIAVYAGTLAVKRYLDLRLQSSGRLQEFLNIEVVSSFLRLLLLGAFSTTHAKGTAVWSSLALGTALSQASWWMRNPKELAAFSGFLDSRAWTALAANTPAYVPYYGGILLKRLKDNIVPIVANRLFVSREVLATFLLALRGVVFAVGQVRILEALMNHRATLNAAAAISRRNYRLVALAAQAVCVTASAALMVSSSLKELPWLASLILSFMVWPVLYLTIERAKAYSTFHANRVNAAISAYLVVVVASAYLLRLSGYVSVTAFAGALVLAESCGYAVLRLSARKVSVVAH